MSPEKNTAEDKTIVFYVSPDGCDQWSGLLPTPKSDKSDGPFATLAAAKKAVRCQRCAAPEQAVRVELRGGTHFLAEPLTFTQADSGIPWVTSNNDTVVGAARPVVYASYKNEKAIISGGRAIDGWEETTINGQKALRTFIPDVKEGKWSFRQLFVNGERRLRPILPRKGFFRIAKLAPSRFDGGISWSRGRNDRFYFEAGDLKAWQNIEDVELVTLQVWIESRMWLRRVEEEKNLVVMDRATLTGLSAGHGDGGKEGTEFFVENVFEALDQPGEWYLNRSEGILYYLPLPGETAENLQVFAPVQEQLLLFLGAADETHRVHDLRFENLHFAHNEWQYPQGVPGSNQAAQRVPGALTLRHVRHIQFHQCVFEHLGTYGIELSEGCRDVEISCCTIRDLGAGGVKIWDGAERTLVRDCEICCGGRVFHSAVGVLVGKSGGNRILHNHIHDFRYSGVSLGWLWRYSDGHAYGNIVEYNHIHDIGHGYLSDMGGIYTLSPQPGTRLRFNLIHNVQARGYGGWGIYTDEGSSYILVENNVVYDCNRSSFHQHYGRENELRNNIFACGGQHQLTVSRAEAHCSVIFERNIVYFDQGELLTPTAGWNKQETWEKKKLIFDRNLYFDARNEPIHFDGKSWEEWQAMGRDQNGKIADPCFVDPENRDFRLRPDSPALALGFIPFDLSTVGPREPLPN